MEYVFLDSQTQMPFVQSGIHREWHAHIDAHDRALILAPREHGKTDQIAIGRVLWELGKNPQLRYKIICQDDENAMHRLASIQGHIERNEHLHEVFPNLKPHPDVKDWSKHTLTVSRQGEDKDPSLEAAGVLSSGTGGRADRLLFDDVVDFKNAIQMPGLREMVKNTIKNVWMNLLTPSGRAVYIATPYHEDDATNELKQNSRWNLLEHPIPEDLTPIWWEHWPIERLKAKLQEIGSRAFARGYHLVSVSDEELLFRNILACLRPDLSRLHIKDHWPRFTGVDPGHRARKDQKEQDEKPYSVIFTLALDERSKRWPVDIRRGHWTGPETAAQIIDVYEVHRPETILIENNNFQQQLIDWIKLVSQDTTIPVAAMTTGANKVDEQVGLETLSAEFDSLVWVIPTDGIGIEDTEKQHGPLWKWIHEMKGYPVASLSDTVMACWFAREATRPKHKIHTPFNREKLDKLLAETTEE